jgi:hypothetical protein
MQQPSDNWGQHFLSRGHPVSYVVDQNVEGLFMKGTPRSCDPMMRAGPALGQRVLTPVLILVPLQVPLIPVGILLVTG